jgi:KUP system potassium uptake protein
MGAPVTVTPVATKHDHVLHQRVVLVTVLIEESLRISDEDRA